MPFHKVLKTAQDIYEYVVNKGIKNYVSVPPQPYDLYHGVLNLGFNIIGKPLKKKLIVDAIIDINDPHNDPTTR